jgi:hypothetical protein
MGQLHGREKDIVLMQAQEELPLIITVLLQELNNKLKKGGLKTSPNQ